MAGIKVSKQAGITFLLFMVYPLLSLPLILKGMLDNKKWGFFFFACFMGMIGMLYPPTGDFYRYTEEYIYIKDFNWEQFKDFILIKQECLLPSISYLFSRLNVPFDYSRFIYNFIAYYLLGLIYIDEINKNVHYIKRNSIYFLGMFISFSLSLYLFRFFFSMILYAYGTYNIVYKRKKQGWIFVILSILNHFSFIVFLVILILTKLLHFKFRKWIVVLMCILAFTISSDLLINLFTFMPADIVNRYSIYLDGYYAGTYLEDHSLRYRILMALSSAITYAAAIIYIITYDKKSIKNGSIVNGVLLVTTLSSPFSAIAYRFATVLLLFIKIQFLNAFNRTRKQCKYLLILFLLTMLSNIMGLWSSRREISISDLSLICYASTPQILMHTYSEQWINKNVYENGDFNHD